MEMFDHLHKQGNTIVLITHDPNIARHAKPLDLAHGFQQHHRVAGEARDRLRQDNVDLSLARSNHHRLEARALLLAAGDA